VTFEGSFAAFTSDDDNAGGQIVEALRCVVPQGLNGCGYESPLESMLAALNPAATWNGDGGFLRQDSGVAVVLLTNEVDCSVEDYSIMENPTYQETNPDTAAKSPSSAICWNAGVDCQGPDPQGMYSGCTSNNVNGLHPITRYTSYLIDTIAGQGRFVVFVPIVGASPDGLESTVYRNWIDGQYPGGDILPPEWMQGVTAGDKQFDFGIGPGCTAQTDVGGWVQALPPVRLRETCEMIEADANGRCCPHSICGDIYTGGFDCLSSAAVELAGG
jgi:hypothetical protein